MVEPLYQNIWSHGDYIYHTTNSGVDVYNNDATSKIGLVVMPSSDEEHRIRIDFNKSTAYENLHVDVTLVSGNAVYSYTTDGNDIHFQDSEENELDFWLEDWNYGGISTMSVFIPVLGTSYIYLYFNNNVGLTYDHGSPHDVSIFYDDFSVVYSGTTGLSSDWDVNSENDFLVSDNKLRVTSSYISYAIATIHDRDFSAPIHIETKLFDISSAGSSLYGQFSHKISTPAGTLDGWHWMGEGAYDRSVYFQSNQQYSAGSGKGFNTSSGTIHTYITEDYIRFVTDRATNPFDDTVSGTPGTSRSDLILFQDYSVSYSVDYVRASRWDGVIGTVVSGTVVEFVIRPAPDSPSAVWADDGNVYIGTNNAGIYITTVPVSGTVSGTVYKQAPYLTSDDVVYLHGAGEYLCVTTTSGVDQYNTVSGTRIYTTVSGSNKCHQTSTGEFYYSIGDTLHAVYSTASNWTDPDYSYDDQLLYITDIHDIFVTEGTSTYGSDNVIFLATDQGVHVVEERKGDETNSRAKRYYLK